MAKSTDYAYEGEIARADKLAVAPGAGCATAGPYGKAVVGDGGWATVGEHGYAICGAGGKARGGPGATLRIDGVEKRVTESEAYVFFTLRHGVVAPLHRSDHQ